MMMEKAKHLSIIIVTYNSLGYLEDCLSSIYACPPESGYDIIVVDNASSDGTDEYVRSAYPDITLIKNDRNRGFAAASNQAIMISDSAYMLLINSDCRVFDNSIEKLLRYFAENKEVAVAGPKILNSDGTIQYSCRRFPSFFGAAAHTLLIHIYPNNPFSKRYKLVDASREKPFPVDWVSGSCMMIRRKALEETGLLDENYFMYVEDIDLCYRMWKKGWEVHYMPYSEVLHHTGGSSSRTGYGNRREEDGQHSKNAEYHNRGAYVYGDKYGGKGVSPAAAIIASYRMQRSVFYFFRKHYMKNFRAVLAPFVIVILGIRLITAGLRSIFYR
jgi:GT2 family glycosyltransferase